MPITPSPTTAPTRSEALQPVQGSWCADWSEDLALFTDLYELTMVQAYWRDAMLEPAVFSLFARRLPPERNFLIACGLELGLRYLERLRFSESTLEYIAGRPEFEIPFIDWLSQFRFTGSVRAIPEGTPVFENEPLLEVEAPLPEAQLVETFLLNQLHFQTALASKAVRAVIAADGRPIIDFGMRRMYGIDAAVSGARAFYIAGVAATSNVLAGRCHGIPVVGTMAHSYIQAHPSEMAAYRSFVAQYPETILLVDTYGTMSGIRNVIELARQLGDEFSVRGVRLDSGDLGTLATQARDCLDLAGLSGIRIVASGGLDEHEIARLVREEAPIDTFAVGTAMGTSADATNLDLVYKLSEYAGQGRTKLSTGKPILPGRKQVYRVMDDGMAMHDVISLADEQCAARPLLRYVMRNGRCVDSEPEQLTAMRNRTAAELEQLPPRIRGLDRADPTYTVKVSDGLAALQREVESRVRKPE